MINYIYYEKKICPPGQICVGSNFLVTILVFVILLLLFFIIGNVLPNNKFTSLEKERPIKKKKVVPKVLQNQMQIIKCQKNKIILKVEIIL